MGELILSDFFTTKSEANEFSARLSTVEANIFEVNFNLEQKLEDLLGSVRKDKFMSLLRENNVSLNSNSDISKFISQINETIKSLPTLDITIATEPKEDILKAMSDWFNLNIKKQVLFDISIDHDIIAGAVVEFNGKRLDTSIKSVFEKICTENLKNPA